MNYWVVIRKKSDLIYFHDYFLPGFIPQHVIEMMVVSFVDKELGLCKGCELACHCHVMEQIEKHAWRKLCPVLFHDTVHPPWKLKDLV